MSKNKMESGWHRLLSPFKTKWVYIICALSVAGNMVDMFQEEGITSSKIINLISISAITLVFLLFLIKKIYSNLSIGIVLYLLVFNIILSTLLGNFHSVDFAAWFLRSAIIIFIIIAFLGIILDKSHIFIAGIIFYLFYGVVLIISKNTFLLNDILMDMILSLSFIGGMYYVLQKIESQTGKVNQLISSHEKMFSIIAHDLRSPLSGISGLSELLSENFRQYNIEKSEEYIRQINSSSKHIIALLENLLVWAKSQTGMIDFNPQKIDIRNIILEVISGAESQAKLKNIIIDYSMTNNAVVFADENMLKTIFRNLLSNAIKFTDKNGNIDIAVISRNELTEITIEDNGIGMNPDMLSALFALNNGLSLNNTARQNGTGLGLVLCKEFIDIHKGEIWAESEVGKGSKFHFTIPVN